MHKAASGIVRKDIFIFAQSRVISSFICSFLFCIHIVCHTTQIPIYFWELEGDNIIRNVTGYTGVVVVR